MCSDEHSTANCLQQALCCHSNSQLPDVTVVQTVYGGSPRRVTNCSSTSPPSPAERMRRTRRLPAGQRQQRHVSDEDLDLLVEHIAALQGRHSRSSRRRNEGDSITAQG